MPAGSPSAAAIRLVLVRETVRSMIGTSTLASFKSLVVGGGRPCWVRGRQGLSRAYLAPAVDFLAVSDFGHSALGRDFTPPPIIQALGEVLRGRDCIWGKSTEVRGTGDDT